MDFLPTAQFSQVKKQVKLMADSISVNDVDDDDYTDHNDYDDGNDDDDDVDKDGHANEE